MNFCHYSELILISSSLFIWISYISLNFILKDNKAFLLIIAAMIMQLAWLGLRIIETGHAPFSGAYESIIFFSFLYSVKIIFLSNWEMKVKNFFLMPIPILLFLGLILPYQLKIPNALMPSLRSFWIYIHVPAFFIGYVSLTAAFIMIFIYKKSGIEKIEEEIKLALFFIATGIITGSIWGDLSWGNFWSYDPKELWAFVTFLFLLGFFHAKSSAGKKFYTILAFFSMLFTYFGVMFLLSGLHSYL